MDLRSKLLRLHFVRMRRARQFPAPRDVGSHYTCVRLASTTGVWWSVCASGVIQTVLRQCRSLLGHVSCPSVILKRKASVDEWVVLECVKETPWSQKLLLSVHINFPSGILNARGCTKNCHNESLNTTDPLHCCHHCLVCGWSTILCISVSYETVATSSGVVPHSRSVNNVHKKCLDSMLYNFHKTLLNRIISPESSSSSQKSLGSRLRN